MSASDMVAPPPTVLEAIGRTRARNSVLSAYISTRLDEAERESAQRATEKARSPIHNLPYGLKDLWDTAGLTTTGCSDRFRDRIPEESAPVHRVFSEAGAVLLGKTNASDLGFAMESANYIGGVTSNPLDPKRTAGGSSGGAAAAVADRMAAFDWGSDFGGSIRLPAAFCGIYGMRLSSEAWPVVGHFPEPPMILRSMNGQGPMTARLDLMRQLLELTAPALRTGKVTPFKLRGAYLYGPTGRMMGEWGRFVEEVQPIAVRALGEVRSDHGLPAIGRAADIGRATYSSHLEDFLEADKSLRFFGALGAVLSSVALRGRLGDRRFHPRTAEMLLLLALGRITLFRDKAKAERDAAQFKQDVRSLFDRGFVLIMPTTTFPAPHHGRVALTWNMAAFNLPGNIADVTTLAMPWGRFENGMPRSVQIWGPPGSELQLIEIAERLESARA